MATVEKLCQSLHRYYESQGKGADYVNADGKGKFTVWCEDNGMTDDDLEENFQSIDDCLFLDFDEDFPLPAAKQNADEDARKQFIFEILIQCNDGAQFNALSFDQDAFDAVNENDVEQIKRIYKKHCPVIFNRDMGDDGNLLMMLAFQKKYGVDYLANLLDSFSRYRIEHRTDMKETDWALLEQNQHFKTLPFRKIKVQIPGKGKSKYHIFATSCMASFNSRCCGKLQFGNQQVLIDDSLQKVAKYISAAAGFIFNTISSNSKGSQVVPFQFDVAIAVGKPVRNGTDDDDDDDDDDEKDDIDYGGGAENKAFADWVQDVKKKLDANKLRYSHVAADADENRRGFGNLFKQFLSEHKVDEVDDSKKHYLADKRLIALIDRRKSKNEDNAKDDIFMYEPPKGGYTRDMPTGGEFMTDWFLSASRTSLLPNAGYDAELVVGNKQMQDQEESALNKPGANIGAADHCQGGMITLSFWVYSADKIKLYLYWNGGMIRVLPRDIKLLLPKIFVDNEENKKYVDGDALKQLIEDLETKLVDKEFESWMETYKVSN